MEDTTLFPVSIDDEGNLLLNQSNSWISGFFPGILWYLYEGTGDALFSQSAKKWMNGLEKEKYNKGTHDLGFIIHCSFGNAYRITGDEKYLDIINQAANSLASRYNGNVKAIKSWDWSTEWKFPVIIDNMMNLEMLYFAGKQFDEDRFVKISDNHAITTINNHFRNDFSSYHVVNYDLSNGQAIWHGTHQGYSDQSAWARGQAWGFYGYLICYRETGKQEYLDQALKIHEFLFNDENMPDDMIVYWDFDDPSIPETYRDASAAAIIASALIELSLYVAPSDSVVYIKQANSIIEELSTPEYFPGDTKLEGFLLDHSVGNLPSNSVVDKPIIFADYYYLETLLRLKKLYLGKDIFDLI